MANLPIKGRLTQRQYEFTKNYIANGFNAQKAALDAGYTNDYARSKATNILTNPVVEHAIHTAYTQANGQLALTWEWKLRKIARVVNECIPDDITVKLCTHKMKVGLAAIAELNRMSGDYAPIKKLSVNLDATKAKLEEAKKVYDEY